MVSMQFGGQGNAISNKTRPFIVPLWENPDETSSFSAQTISLDLTEFDAVLVTARVSTTAAAKSSLVVVKDQGDFMITTIRNFPDASALQFTRRNISATDTGVTISAGTAKSTTSTSAGSTNNGYCVPVMIYGIHFW